MNLPRFHFRSEKGDTIVEVLISIAIISLILGGAYAATNHSLNATRDAQERSDGLKLVESQIEQMKNLAANSPSTIFGSTPSSYCISSGAVLPSTDNSCKVNAAGVYSAGNAPQYNLAITRSGNIFTVVNSWDGILGKTSFVQMKYRLYQ